jgi:hypothetical protein
MLIIGCDCHPRSAYLSSPHPRRVFRGERAEILLRASPRGATIIARAPTCPPSATLSTNTFWADGMTLSCALSRTGEPTRPHPPEHGPA